MTAHEAVEKAQDDTMTVRQIRQAIASKFGWNLIASRKQPSMRCRDASRQRLRDTKEVAR